ncbi:MAG: cyclic nucleotide-binding domain-containing protein [Alphaproteobacteria bacterium]|nr:cyclic nucleotide-binding domain-containing protein [Alphaproteobacteria bacterium]
MTASTVPPHDMSGGTNCESSAPPRDSVRARQPGGTGMLRRSVTHGEVIIRSGQRAEAAWRVARGHVVVRSDGPAGKASETLADAGDVIGAVAVLDGAHYDQTAEAHGEAVVEMLPREELVRLLTASPDTAGRMLGGLFSAVVSGDDVPDGRVPDGARLYGLEGTAAASIGADGIGIDGLSFVVGRKESVDDSGAARGVDLTLPDMRPYQLSRRHFAIERNLRGWLVRDCGSYHGTYVNGLLTGASKPSCTAPLLPGENEIVAGTPGSAFRFRVAVAG